MLEKSGIDPNGVLVMRHRPWEPSLNLVFDSIAAEHHELFNCYQSTHGPRTEAALKNAKHLAACIRHDAGTAVFIGLYSVNGHKLRSAAEIESRELHQKLVQMGMSGDFATRRSDIIAEFNLAKTDWAQNWQQRMIIKWPGIDRAWYQWAGRGTFQVKAVNEDSVIQTEMPSWQQICPTWAELKVLPQKWQNALRHWRGIYLITDSTDSKQYVGSASGSENILQRWNEYAITGHGGNKHLQKRSPAKFRFSILERVSPDAPNDEVVRLEQSWKRRLVTNWPNGLNDN